MILSTISLISSIFWTKVMIGILIDLLNTVEVIFNIPKAYLGLTILAIGNAMVDGITTISLCAQGAGTLAISGGYVGQLFGYLIGFGASMLRITIESGDQEFDLFNIMEHRENILSLAALGTTLFVLVVTFIYGVVNKFRMERNFALFMIFVYIAFLAGTTWFCIEQVMDNPDGR